MDITCQYCGATATDRVMCPSCGRRMQPADAWPTPPDPTQPVSPVDEALPPPGYFPPPQYGAAHEQVGPWGGPLVPVVLFDRTATVRTARASVLFRLVLAIPHIVILYLLGLADALITVICWFAALFTGRVPQGMYGFMAWVAAYQTRFAAYSYLLTDKWPTFSETDPYPIAIQFPGPERLNRWAVFFRWLLAIPASAMAAIAGFGAAVLLTPVGWLIVVIAGRVPTPLFDSLARVTRYQIRLRAYYSMLTSAYPCGLFSDKNEPFYQAPPPGRYAPVPAQPNSGKSLSVTYTVLGVAGAAGYIAIIAATIGPAVQSINAYNDLVDDYNGLNIDPPSCPPGGSQLQCVQSYSRSAAAQMRTFHRRVSDISFPSAVSNDVATVNDQTQTLINDFDQFATVRSPLPQYAVVTSVEPDIAAFDQAVHALADDLD